MPICNKSLMLQCIGKEGMKAEEQQEWEKTVHMAQQPLQKHKVVVNTARQHQQLDFLATTDVVHQLLGFRNAEGGSDLSEEFGE